MSLPKSSEACQVVHGGSTLYIIPQHESSNIITSDKKVVLIKRENIDDHIKDSDAHSTVLHYEKPKENISPQVRK